MMKLIIAFLLFVPLFMMGQVDVPDLITDRPDQTESSATVPVKSLQIETGFILKNDITENINHKSYTYNTTLLRYGLFKNFELRLGLEYLSDIEEDLSTLETKTFSGFSPLHTGFKVKITEENGLLPEIAFLGGLVFPTTARDVYKPANTSANMRFTFSHTLSERFSLGYNIGAEWDGDTPVPGYFYSLALGVSLSSRLGMFVESYGSVPEAGNAEHMLDAGFTFLILPNLQADLSGGLGINEFAADNFLSFGLTYRIPR